MIFNEVYIGRTPEIQEMFGLFCESRELYRRHKVTAARKKLSEMEPIIEDFFGFGTFCLDLENDPEINAFTYPVGISLDVDPTEKLYTSDSKGYHFDKKAYLAAISRITTGLFGNDNFTDGEVFAALLHEIGHSFTLRSPLMEAEYDANRAALISQLITQTILGIIFLQPQMIGNAAASAILSTNFYKAFIANMQKIEKRIPFVRCISYQFKKITNFTFRGITNVVDVIFTITGLNYILGKINNYNNTTDLKTIKTSHPNAYARSNERLSDDFATTYGFGEELATILLKFDNRAYVNSGYRKFQDHCPVLNKLYQAQRELAYDYVWALGAHPSSSDRIESVIENMEHDLKKDKSLSEKERKTLEEQLKRTKKLAADTIKGQGEIEKNKDEYLKAMIMLGFKNGSGETDSERDYTDMDGLDKRFKELHEIDMNMDIFGLDFL